MKHTAIYVRVSSKAQDHACQLPDLERWVAAHDGAVQWYRDKFTGKTMDRPGMEKLLADLRAGLVERIVVWRLDRLGRTTRGLCQLFDELGERKVDLVSLKDGFSLGVPCWSASCPHLGIGGRIRNRGPCRTGCSRSSRRTTKGKKWGGSQAGLAVEGSDDQVRHQRNEGGREEDHAHRQGHGAFTAHDLPGAARCSMNPAVPFSIISSSSDLGEWSIYLNPTLSVSRSLVDLYPASRGVLNEIPSR